MSNEIIDKLDKENSLTLEEISCVLEEITNIARKELEKTSISDTKKCVESDRILGNICYKFKIDYLPMRTSLLEEDMLYHEFGLVIFNTYDNDLIYLFDLTYNQFSIEPEYKKIFPEKNLNSQYSQDLVKYGYLPFTKENFEKYVDGFVKAKENIQKLKMSKENFDYNYWFNKLISSNLGSNPIYNSPEDYNSLEEQFKNGNKK